MVIPSRLEPWGIVCVEAKAAAKPVLATAVDGLSEQVQSCGMLVSSSDPAVLAPAITQFVNTSPQQLQTWARMAAKRPVIVGRRLCLSGNRCCGRWQRGCSRLGKCIPKNHEVTSCFSSFNNDCPTALSATLAGLVRHSCVSASFDSRRRSYWQSS